VLLDYSMPDMNGEETLRALRKVTPDIPVLLSSGFSEEEVIRRFEGLDLAGFIQKPYRLATLLAAIRNCSGRQKAGDPANEQTGRQFHHGGGA